MSDTQKVKPIDRTKINLEELKKKTSDIPGLIEYAHSVGGFQITPTKEGVIKGKALQAMQEQTGMHLDMIYEQMMLLAKQTQEIKSRVEISEGIYEAKMRFEPVIGGIYYLYHKGTGAKALSIVAPEEWNGSSPLGEAIGKIRLLADHTWEVLRRYDPNEDSVV